MLVNRVVNHLLNVLKCEEITSKKVVHPYRKFKLPNTQEKLFVTNSMVFIGPSFNNCRPAYSIINNANVDGIK